MIKLFFVATILVASVHANGDPKDVHAETLRNEAEIDEHGAYKYAYATSNEIAAQESGVGGVIANGEFSYTAPEGDFIKLEYSADENGFQPKGDHLPLPHPIPDSILKSLEYIRTHPYPNDDVRLEESLAAFHQHQQRVSAPIKQQQQRQQHRITQRNAQNQHNVIHDSFSNH